MAVRVFSLPEHGLITKAKAGEASKEHSAGVVLRTKDFDALERWMSAQNRQEKNKRPTPPDGSESDPMPITYDARKREGLRVRNYAGIVLLPSGDSLEILPKITEKLDENSKARGRKILCNMLSTVHHLSNLILPRASLGAGKMPLLEIFITCFLNDVSQLIRRGICSGYTPVEANLPCLRGKLMLPQHIRTNSIHRERFYVTYDEYLPDRPENRLVKTALLRVLAISGNPQNKWRCKQFLNVFEFVPASANIRADLAACMSLERNTRHYRTPLFWSRLLLQSETPIPSPGNLECTAVLFPMEKLFEAYVAIQIRRKISPQGWNVVAQARRKHLVEEHQGVASHMLKPDLLLERKFERVVADTKWKHIDQKNDIANADLYQLFAYSEKYLPENPNRLTFLIYPRTDSFREPLPEFHFYKDTAILRAVPFDLETNYCPLFEFLNENGLTHCSEE